MEGHHDLAMWLADIEKCFALRAFRGMEEQVMSCNGHGGNDDCILVPMWLQGGVTDAERFLYKHVSAGQLNEWEAGGGIKRMSWHVLMQAMESRTCI